MAGLLDILGGNFGTDDPRQAAYLALASGLMSGRGNFGQVLGQAAMGAQDTFQTSRKAQQQAQQAQQQAMMTKMQMEEIQRKAKQQQEMQALEEQFRTSLVSPQQQATQDALADGGGPTVTNAANMRAVDPYQQMAYQAMQSKLMSPLDFMKLQQKDTAPIKMGKEDRLFAPGTYKELISAAPEKPDKPHAPPAGFTRGPDGQLSVDPEWFRVSKELRAAGRAPAGGGVPDANLELSADAIDIAAERYLHDGTLPPMGMGRQGTAGRTKILGRAAELAKAAGISGEDLRVGQVANKANAGALLQLTKQEQAVGNFEKTAVRNLDIALEQSNKVNRTGIPVLNRWIMAGQKELLGDPEVSAFHVANETFVSEYAKIMSGSMGNTVVSDSLRKEVHSMLATKNTKEQYKAATDIMRREMKNRIEGFKEQKAELRGEMKRGGEKKTIKFDAQGNMVP